MGRPTNIRTLFKNTDLCDHPTWRLYRHDVPLAQYELPHWKVRTNSATQCLSCGHVELSNEPQLRLKVLAGMSMKGKRLYGPEIRFVYETIGSSRHAICASLKIVKPSLDEILQGVPLHELQERALRLAAYVYLLERAGSLHFALNTDEIRGCCSSTPHPATGDESVVLDLRNGQVRLLWTDGLSRRHARA